ncbi:MAG: SLATT domain-containing protein [Acidimicrobiia bacterium]
MQLGRHQSSCGSPRSESLAAAAAAWTQTNQHATLASSYVVAAQELAAVATLVDLQRSENDWSRFVDSSEAAISRAHTLWRAFRAR